MEKKFKKGIDPALDKVPKGQVSEVKRDLMEILKIKSNTAFWYYRKGLIIPSADKAAKIIEYFKKRGIDVYE